MVCLIWFSFALKKTQVTTGATGFSTDMERKRRWKQFHGWWVPEYIKKYNKYFTFTYQGNLPIFLYLFSTSSMYLLYKSSRDLISWYDWLCLSVTNMQWSFICILCLVPIKVKRTAPLRHTNTQYKRFLPTDIIYIWTINSIRPPYPQ